jgi:general secretion pathway protein G
MLLRKKAFTLIEIMLVVIIIGVLAAMVVPNISGRSEQSRRTAARTDIDANISTALDLYRMDTGRYPSTDQGLLSLVAAPAASAAVPNWSGPYLKKKRLPQDPWGRPYAYTSPGTHNRESYDLSSLGPDGVESKDDISNWEAAE